MNRLKEIDIIRCVVILMLIAVHVFAPYTDAWPLPKGCVSNELFSYIGKICYNGMLETFFFISGCVLAIKKCPTEFPAKVFLLYKRLKRLYVPCLIFGVITVIIVNGFGDLYNNLGRIISGAYHLWFLPVLFWCWFFEIFIVQRLRKHVLLLLAFLAVLPYPYIPFNMNLSFYYLFFL